MRTRILAPPRRIQENQQIKTTHTPILVYLPEAPMNFFCHFQFDPILISSSRGKSSTFNLVPTNNPGSEDILGKIHTSFASQLEPQVRARKELSK